MGIFKKTLKVGIRGLATVGAFGVDLVTTAIALPPKMFTESKDSTPFLTENAGKKLMESFRELSKEIDNL